MVTVEDRAFKIYADLLTYRYPGAQFAEVFGCSDDGLQEFAATAYRSAVAFAREAARRDAKGELLNGGLPADESDNEGWRE